MLRAVAANKNEDSGRCVRLLSVWSCCASHVSVPDVLPVHQHVVPSQRPHLALTCHHVDLQLFAAFFVHLWGSDSVDAVLGETGHRLSVKNRQMLDGTCCWRRS